MEVREEKAVRGEAMTVRLGDEEIEAIAGRVVELLRLQGGGVGLIDAAEVARRLGISRGTVYERAEELGAIRLGAGPRARLRFDPQQLAGRLGASRRTGPTNGPEARQAAVRSRRRRRTVDRTGLLPIRGGPTE